MGSVGTGVEFPILSHHCRWSFSVHNGQGFRRRPLKTPGTIDSAVPFPRVPTYTVVYPNPLRRVKVLSWGGETGDKRVRPGTTGVRETPVCTVGRVSRGRTVGLCGRRNSRTDSSSTVSVGV